MLFLTFFFILFRSSGRELVLLKRLDRIMAEFFGPNLPASSQLEKRATLALVNSNPILDQLGPIQDSNVIPIGGIHVTDSKPLSQVSFIVDRIIKKS